MPSANVTNTMIARRRRHNATARTTPQLDAHMHGATAVTAYAFYTGPESWGALSRQPIHDWPRLCSERRLMLRSCRTCLQASCKLASFLQACKQGVSRMFSLTARQHVRPQSRLDSR
jgi:hypothetical protein